MKFYNLGHKTFETDFSNYQGSALSGACVPCMICVWAKKMCRNRRKKCYF